MKYLLILLSTLVVSRRYKEEKFIRDLQDLIDELEEGVGDFEEQVGDLENFDTDHFIESAVGESDDFDSIDDASLFRSLWDSDSSDYLESVLDSYDESEVGDSYDSDDYDESEVGDSYDSYDSDILDSLESDYFDSDEIAVGDSYESALGDSLDSYDSDDLDMYPRDSFDIYESDDMESDVGEGFGESLHYANELGDYSQLYDMTDSAELYKDDSFETAVGEEEIDDYKMLYDGDDYVDLDSKDFEIAVGDSDEVALGDSDEFYEEIPTPGEEYAVGDAFLDETVDEDEVPVDEWFEEEALGDIYSGEDMDLFNEPEEIPVAAHGFDFLQETDSYVESDEEWH